MAEICVKQGWLIPWCLGMLRESLRSTVILMNVEEEYKNEENIVGWVKGH